MFKLSFFITAVLALISASSISSAQGFNPPGMGIKFKATHLRATSTENIHVTCPAGSDEVLCNLTFASFEYPGASSGKANKCTISVLPLEPMKFKKQANGSWEHISKPSVLCGEVSNYVFQKDPADPFGLGWALTITSKETDRSSPMCKDRKPAESITKYTFTTGPNIKCEALEFAPGIF